jgi:CheY-like chemotaxis protein
MNSCCILLVEDDENDVFFMKRAFAAAGIGEAVRVVEDGQQAVDYLLGCGKFADHAQFPSPSLVLLDLKLPQIEGLDVLKWIREKAELRDLKVIILTSSPQTDDVRRASELGANGYVLKPTSIQQRDKLAEAIKAVAFQNNLAVLQEWQSPSDSSRQ